MPITAVFFDLDDTLYDCRSWIKECRLNASSRIRQYFPQYTENQIYNTMTKVSKEKGAFYERLLYETAVHLGISPNDSKFHIAIAEAEMEYKRRNYDPVFLAPYPNAREILEKIGKDRALGIITNGNSSVQWRKLVVLGLRNTFSSRHVVIADGVYSKPHPKIYEFALSRIGSERSKTMFVDDNEQNVLGAKNVGMVGVLKRHKARKDKPVKSKPDFVIDDLSELLAILNIR